SSSQTKVTESTQSIQHSRRSSRTTLANLTPERTYTTGRSEPPQDGIPVCNRCGRRHAGVCRLISGACLKCGEIGHYIKDCPQMRDRQNTPTTSSPTVQQSRAETGHPSGRGRGAPSQTTQGGRPSTSRGQGRVFALNQQEAQTSNTTVAGIVS